MKLLLILLVSLLVVVASAWPKISHKATFDLFQLTNGNVTNARIWVDYVGGKLLTQNLGDTTDDSVIYSLTLVGQHQKSTDVIYNPSNFTCTVGCWNGVGCPGSNVSRCFDILEVTWAALPQSHSVGACAFGFPGTLWFWHNTQFDANVTNCVNGTTPLYSIAVDTLGNELMLFYSNFEPQVDESKFELPSYCSCKNQTNNELHISPATRNQRQLFGGHTVFG